MYRKGEVTVKENYYDGTGKMAIMLPHSCDAWVIGSIKDAETMLEDLKEAIEKLKIIELTKG